VLTRRGDGGVDDDSMGTSAVVVDDVGHELAGIGHAKMRGAAREMPSRGHRRRRERVANLRELTSVDEQY
jgi:hypothetical protein